MTDEFHGQGGRYEIRDGKRVQVEAPTKDHPEGNCARDADGKAIPGPGADIQKPVNRAPRRTGKGAD
jgi:hypothetical protein